MVSPHQPQVISQSARGFLIAVERIPSKGSQEMGSFDISSSMHNSRRKTMSRQEISWERGSATNKVGGPSSILEDKDGSVSLSVKSPTGVMDADYTATYHWKRTPALSLFGKNNKRCPPTSRRSRRHHTDHQRSNSVDREHLTALDEHVDNIALSSRRQSQSENTDSKVALSRRNAIRKSTSHRGFGTTSNVLEEHLAIENPASHQRSFSNANRTTAAAATTTTTTNIDAAPQIRRRMARRNQYERAYSTSCLLTSSETGVVGIDRNKSSGGGSSSSSVSVNKNIKGSVKKARKKRTPSSSSSVQSGKVSVSSSTRSQRKKDKKVNTSDEGQGSTSLVRSKRESAASGVRQRTTGGRKTGGAVDKPSVPEDTGSKRVLGIGRGTTTGVGKRMPPRSKRKGRLMDLPKTTKPAVLLSASADINGSKTKNKVAATQASIHNNPPFLPLHQCPTHFDFITVPVMRDESGRSTRSGSISSLSMSSLDARSISSHRSRCRFRQNYSSSKLFLKASLIKEDDRDSGNEDDNDIYMDTGENCKELRPVQPFHDTELEIPDTTPSSRSNRTGIISELTAPTMASGHSALLYTDNKKADRTQRPTMSRWHSIADIMSSEENQERESTSVV